MTAEVVGLVHGRGPVAGRAIHAQLVDAGARRRHDALQLILVGVSGPMSEHPAHLVRIADKSRRCHVREALVAALELLAACAPLNSAITRFESRQPGIRGTCPLAGSSIDELPEQRRAILARPAGPWGPEHAACDAPSTQTTLNLTGMTTHYQRAHQQQGQLATDQGQLTRWC